MPTPLPWRSSVARHDAWNAWEQDNTVTSRTLMGARQMEQGSAGALGVAGALFFAGFCGVAGAAPPFFDFFPADRGAFFELSGGGTAGASRGRPAKTALIRAFMGLISAPLSSSAALPVWKSKFYGAFVLNRRVDLHAIDATLVDFHTGVDWISARFFARASAVGDVRAPSVAVDVSEMPAPARFIR